MCLRSARIITGCNHVCTAVHHALDRLFKLHVSAREQRFIRHLTIQVDNACSENKNHLVVAYLGSLIARSIICKVSLQFMPVGHTHIKIDQAFSRKTRAKTGVIAAAKTYRGGNMNSFW